MLYHLHLRILHITSSYLDGETERELAHTTHCEIACDLKTSVARNKHRATTTTPKTKEHLSPCNQATIKRLGHQYNRYHPAHTPITATATTQYQKPATSTMSRGLDINEKTRRYL